MGEKPSYEELEHRIKGLEKRINDAKQDQKTSDDTRIKQELLDIAPYGMFLIDLLGTIIFTTGMAAERLGKTRKEMVGTKLVGYFPSDISQNRRLKGVEAVSSGNPQKVEDQIGDRWYYSKICPVKDKSGMITSIAIFSDDITDRKRAEDALRESEERFRNLAENSIVGVNIIQDGIFKYVNLKFAEIFGYSVAECLNNIQFRQLVHPEDLGIVQENIRKRVSGESKSVYYAFRGIKKSGETIHVEIFGSSTQLNGKAATFATILDITARKQAEREREKLISELKEALANVKTLSGLLPICSYCKNVRDDKGYWGQIESYLHKHSDADFSHGICPVCAEKYFADFDLFEDSD